MRDTRLDPLPSELRRRREQARWELENGIIWIDGCPTTVGVEVIAAVETFTNMPRRVLAMADQRLGEEDDRTWVSAERLRGQGDEETRLDALAAVVNAFVWLASHDDVPEDSGYGNRPDIEPEYDQAAFIALVNDRLLHARVDWLFEDGRFQERGNYVMHSEVLRPATILLGDDPVFKTASDAFQSALTRLSKGETDIALTQAATALQEFFRALDVEGNSVANQLDNAQRAKVISGADRSLMKPLIDWVNADRSDRGNAHRHREGDVTKADAWLMMHVVGALMVRLSNREPRDIIAAREKREADAERASNEAASLARESTGIDTPSRTSEPWDAPTDRYGDDTPF
ncbi:hypothetical protein ACFVSU_07650 [Microbacterium sp. NPDC058062]|uniref:hypothetical protein n=1 Tax=Microbacterium sp. NPDC058062 TaxID=3346320 RepID=UPI0036D90A00